MRGYPFDTVGVAQPAAAGSAPAVPGSAVKTDIATFALAYQMMRDAKALPTRKFPCVAGGVIPLASNAQRLTPMFVRIRAAMINSVSRPYLYVGTDMSQTQACATLDRIGDGGQIEFLLYPGQELWGSYAGDALTTGDAYVSVATFDDAVIQAKRATGQAT